MTRRIGLSAFALLLALSAGAQRNSERRASIVGGGNSDSGKCTIEVDVDGSAEVEISGDRGYLRTLSGQDATWRRIECSGPLPRNMANFEFQGIDGRGRQTLVRDPRSNGGRAIVRIDDPKGGREGYTFDLLWKGGGGSGGYFGDPRDRDNRDRDRRDSWSREINFNGRGEGYLRRFRGEDRLNELELIIARNDDVRATFRTPGGASIVLSGRVTNREDNRITASVSGSGISGPMHVDTDRGRVRNVSMDGGPGRGRNYFELRWHD